MEVLRYKELDYVLRMPENYAQSEKYPLVIYVHGAGGRGREIERIVTHPFFIETETFLKNAVSVAPQCYANAWFDIFEQLQDFIAFMIAQKYVDETRVYLVGASMGGYTTWQMAMTHPEWFAAIVPICGGGMYWNAARLKDMGVWAFHGADDKTVLPEESKKMVDRVNICGGKAKLTVYDGVAHNAWTPAFQTKALWDWLFAQTCYYEETVSQYDNVKLFG
ncbi:MAG: prolyl oligopeptidase family serine peptidase [Clostridia bacterium]|nr:prolyl oligopeptidase family serine peptidase [Clostridia bacterium]